MSRERVGCLGRAKLVVVVDDKPRVLWPHFEIGRQELGNCVDFLFWLATRRQPFAEPLSGSRAQLIRGLCDSERERGDVGRSSARLVPGVLAVREPLAGGGGLVLTGPAEQP